MKAIILSQVSTNDQQEGHSIEAPKAKLREYCELRRMNMTKKQLNQKKGKEKRQLINFMFSNLRINGKKLMFDLKKPFNLMANFNRYPEWLGR